MTIAAIAAPVHARLVVVPTDPGVGQLELAEGFVALVTAPGTPWLPNALALGPGPTVVWDPVVAPVEPGPALVARGTAILRALGVARPADAGAALAETATRPPRAAVAALVEALGSGDVAARLRATLALLGRGPGLTPEGDDLLAGAAVVAAAAGDPLTLPPALRTLTTPLSATLLELAAAGAGPLPVHALLDPSRRDWRDALRELEGVGAAAAVLGAPRPAARCATLPA